MGFFPPPLAAVGAEERACQDAWRAAAVRCAGRPAHLRPPSHQPLQAGKQGRHPSSCFLFLIGTHPPKGHHISFITRSHLRDVCDKLTPFSPAFLKLSPTRQARPCPALGKASGSPSRKKLHISRTAMSCLLFPVLIYDKRKVIRAIKIQSYSSTLASSDREVNAAKCAAK